MQRITKEKGSVYTSTNFWQVLKNQVENSNYSQMFILTDSNTTTHCLPVLLNKIPLLTSATRLEMPAGETYKNIDTCVSLWSQLSQHKADRHSLLINLGGGVVTDTGGFVAATYMRGIEWINIPTSLLAMVDAAVGGKNGVDLGILKNHIGIILPPQYVGIDLQFLKTLPSQELVSGYAEMLKHGLIYSEAYWEALKTFDFENPANNETLVYKSIEIKNEIVTKDPFEKNERKQLNYGHTLGHAIESYFLAHPKKPQLLHGEAIAIGLILATFISTKTLGFPKATCDEIKNVIKTHFNTITFTKDDIDHVISLLIHDKKNTAGQVNFVLLTHIGNCNINQHINNALIFEAFEYYALN